MSASNINVTVLTEDQPTTDYVANVVRESLANAGFVNTTLSTAAGEPADSSGSARLLDLINQGDQRFFSTPVTVVSTVRSTDERFNDSMLYEDRIIGDSGQSKL